MTTPRDRELPGSIQKPGLPGSRSDRAKSAQCRTCNRSVGWPISNLVMNMGIQAVGTGDVPSRQSSASRQVPVPGLVLLGTVRQEAGYRADRKLRTALRVVGENAKKGRVDSELGPSFDEGHGTSSFRGTCCPFLYARRPRPTSASPPASSLQKQPPREARSPRVRACPQEAWQPPISLPAFHAQLPPSGDRHQALHWFLFWSPGLFATASCLVHRDR